MADWRLHGNGTACPACELRREEEDVTQVLREPVPCNNCQGRGRVALSDEEIIRATVARARESYWKIDPAAPHQAKTG